MPTARAQPSRQPTCSKPAPRGSTPTWSNQAAMCSDIPIGVAVVSSGRTVRQPTAGGPKRIDFRSKQLPLPPWLPKQTYARQHALQGHAPVWIGRSCPGSPACHVLVRVTQPPVFLLSCFRDRFVHPANVRRGQGAATRATRSRAVCERPRRRLRGCQACVSSPVVGVQGVSGQRRSCVGGQSHCRRGEGTGMRAAHARRVDVRWSPGEWRSWQAIVGGLPLGLHGR